MKKRFENYIGEFVTITLKDGNKLNGLLRKGNDELNNYLIENTSGKYYFKISCVKNVVLFNYSRCR